MGVQNFGQVSWKKVLVSQNFTIFVQYEKVFAFNSGGDGLLWSFCSRWRAWGKD
jgi:hypothetical protein